MDQRSDGGVNRKNARMAGRQCQSHIRQRTRVAARGRPDRGCGSEGTGRAACGVRTAWESVLRAQSFSLAATNFQGNFRNLLLPKHDKFLSEFPEIWVRAEPQVRI